mgnify:CR=1 FL=1
MDQNKIAFLPACGFLLIQAIKFIKLSIIHEVLLALCISIPYIYYLSPRNVREIGTQTDMDFETIEQIHQRNIFELIMYFLRNIFKNFIK